MNEQDMRDHIGEIIYNMCHHRTTKQGRYCGVMCPGGLPRDGSLHQCFNNSKKVDLLVRRATAGLSYPDANQVKQFINKLKPRELPEPCGPQLSFTEICAQARKEGRKK